MADDLSEFGELAEPSKDPEVKFVEMGKLAEGDHVPFEPMTIDEKTGTLRSELTLSPEDLTNPNLVLEHGFERRDPDTGEWHLVMSNTYYGFAKATTQPFLVTNDSPIPLDLQKRTFMDLFLGQEFRSFVRVLKGSPTVKLARVQVPKEGKG